MLSLEVEIAVLTNVELDHHATFSSLAQLRDDFRELLAAASTAVVWDRPELLELAGPGVVAYDAASIELTAGGSRFRWRGARGRRSRSPACTTRPTPPARSRRRASPGAGAEAALAALAGFAGAGRRFQRLGTSARGAEVYEDYAHHPTEVAATLQRRPHARAAPARRRLPAAPVLAHGAAGPRVRRARWPRADVVVVLDVYPARERAEDFPGVSGLQIAEAAADAAAGRPVYWLPGFAEARGRPRGAAAARATSCVVMGAGDVDELGRGTRRRRRAGERAARRACERDVPLARLTTVRTGGRGEFFARAGEDERALLELLAWAAGAGARGLGRRLGLEPADRRRRACRGWC